MPTKIDGNNGVLQSYDFQVLTTGFSYTFASGTTTLIAVPAGTLATGTITMPGSPADGMVITITTTQQITALTINAAKMAGAPDRVGSLEKGKIANVIVTDGDLFADATRVRRVFVDGRSVDIR